MQQGAVPKAPAQLDSNLFFKAQPLVLPTFALASERRTRHPWALEGKMRLRHQGSFSSRLANVESPVPLALSSVETIRRSFHS